MHQIKSHFRITFGCQVIEYEEVNFDYKVRFKKGKQVVQKFISQKYLDDRDPEKSHADYWATLFNTVEEELNNLKGGNP
jgi:hypothetical protein